MNLHEVFSSLKISGTNIGTSTGQISIGGDTLLISSSSPADGNIIGSTYSTSSENYELVIRQAQAAFQIWRSWPAPKRGEVVRQLGDAFRTNKQALGTLVSYEMQQLL